MDNPPAFPSKYHNREGDLIFEDGMSLRDYVAAEALKGILANPSGRSPEDLDGTIQEAFGYANAFLKFRE